MVSYFLGNDPDRWQPDVPAWGGVRYVRLYPGVDLEIASEAGQWHWRLIASTPSSAAAGEGWGEGAATLLVALETDVRTVWVDG